MTALDAPVSVAPNQGRMSALGALLRAATAEASSDRALRSSRPLARDAPPPLPWQRFAFAPSHVAFAPTPSKPAVDPFSYDVIIVAFSGGKDSLALLLLLLLLGVPQERIELWHHDVDGREGSTLMDWPCTRDYCRQIAAAFGVRIYFSWKVGGFEGEMLRDQTPTAAYLFETPYGLERAGGESDKPGYRRQFPMKTGDLGKRWCSAYTKTHVGECTRHHRVLALRDGDPADPSFPRTPVRPASRVHRAGRAPLRSD